MTFDHHELMHGRDFAGQDVSGWLAQEKFRGFRACWNCTELRSRQGEKFSAPDWFIAGLPAAPLDAELYLGPNRESQLNGMVWNRNSPLWREARLMVFDAPMATGGILERLASVHHDCAQVTIADVFTVGPDIGERLAALLAAGGEGFMLREPDAPYTRGRSKSLLKLKS